MSSIKLSISIPKDLYEKWNEAMLKRVKKGENFWGIRSQTVSEALELWIEKQQEEVTIET